MMYLVTVKLPKNPKHNPHDKQLKRCPVNEQSACTDATGEHHTIAVISALSLADVHTHYAQQYHVTRIETVREAPHELK